MAPVLDVGPLSFFTPILIFILVFVIVYAFFEKAKALGESKELHALAAFVLAILFVLVRPLREFVTTVTPWIVVLFLLIIFVLLGVMIIGFKEKDITSYVSDNPGVTVAVVVIILIIFIAGLSSVFPDDIGLPGEDDESVFGNLRTVVFNAKVLGVLLILAIAYFVVRSVGFIKE